MKKIFIKKDNTSLFSAIILFFVFVHFSHLAVAQGEQMIKGPESHHSKDTEIKQDLLDFALKLGRRS